MPITPDHCAGEQSPGRLLPHVAKLVRSRMERGLAGRNSNSEQWLALKLLNDSAIGNVSELARELCMNSGGVTRLLDALEDRGWIERDRSRDDRRQVRLVLTPEGVNEVKRLTPVVIAAWNDILSVFTEGEFQEFVRLLALLKQGLQIAPSGQTEAIQ